MFANYVADTLRANPQLAIFITLGIGYWIGAIRFKSFTLGAVTGTLLAGIVIGQLGIDISGQVKSLFFIMFLFAVGFGVGPRIRPRHRDGRRAPGALCRRGLGTLSARGLCRSDRFGLRTRPRRGLARGLDDDLCFDRPCHRRDQPVGAEARGGKGPAGGVIPVAYAITYLFGTVGTGWILAFLGPKLLGVDIAAECARYEREMSAGAPKATFISARRGREVRAYRVKEGGQAVGKTVAATERLVEGERIFIENLRSGGEIVPFTTETVLKAGDIAAVSGRREVLVNILGEAEAIEIDDKELLDIPVEAVDVLLTSKTLDGRTLAEASQEPHTRGVFLNSIRRGSAAVNIPVLPQTKLNRGDILHVVGTSADIARFVKAVGFADRPTTITNMVLVGFAILVGGLIGAAVLPIGGVPITLSTSGGALIAGIFVGWLRTVKPQIGNVPQATLWFMNSVGLNVFIAIVGISSGPTFIAGLKQAASGIFFWGLFATSLPMLLAPLIGKYIFRFDPAINLGCCGGARTSTASVAMVGEIAKSDVPMLGYTVPYAVSNTFLTLWGLVIVLLLK